MGCGGLGIDVGYVGDCNLLMLARGPEPDFNHICKLVSGVCRFGGVCRERRYAGKVYFSTR